MTEASGEVLARLSASPARRAIAAAAMGMIGVVLLSLAVDRLPGFIPGAILLAAAGGCVLWLGWLIWQRCQGGLTLTREALLGPDGKPLCRIADIASVETGVLAFRPSNGFLLRLRSPGAFALMPGLWWRIGRRLGIGGIVTRDEARAMAMILKELVKDQEKH